MEEDYQKRSEAFTAWARSEGLGLRTMKEKDAALAKFGTHMFLEGYSSADFGKVRAAAVYTWGLAKGGPELVRTRRAQTGFSKMAPAESRLPLPLCMMAATAVVLHA